MKTKDKKYLNDRIISVYNEINGIKVLATFALIIAIIALLNPHIEKTLVTETKLVKTSYNYERRFVSYDTNLCTQYFRCIYVTEVKNYSCTEKVNPEDTFGNEDNRLEYLSLIGKGACDVTYTKFKYFIKWF